MAVTAPARAVDSACEGLPVADGARLGEGALAGAGMLDLRALRYFSVLVEEMHFGRAAARLNLSQPGLSRSIAALETRLSCRLLTREHHRLELTAAGGALYRHSENLLRQEEIALRDLAALRHVGPRSFDDHLGGSRNRTSGARSPVFSTDGPELRELRVPSTATASQAAGPDASIGR